MDMQKKCHQLESWFAEQGIHADIELVGYVIDEECLM